MFFDFYQYAFVDIYFYFYIQLGSMNKDEV